MVSKIDKMREHGALAWCGMEMIGENLGLWQTKVKIEMFYELLRAPNSAEVFRLVESVRLYPVFHTDDDAFRS